MRNHWLLLYSVVLLMTGKNIAQDPDNVNNNNNNESKPKDLVLPFSPRMDYEQWKPLGRGDPLKNDPTYDYVPPVLDRVHYWIEPSQRKPDPPISPVEPKKTEILLLGVTAKKPTTDSRKDFDNFLKFVDGPKFNSHHHQRAPRPHYPIGTNHYHTTIYKKKVEQRVPYTMLMPPPVVTKKVNPFSFTSIKETTQMEKQITTTPPSSMPSNTLPTTHVTLQQSNLIYQSSSVSDVAEWMSTTTTTKAKPPPPPESYIQIQFLPQKVNNYNNKPLVAANSDQTINYVTPPPLHEEVMHKGEVSDDIDESDTYVKIGKTEAQVHSTGPEMIPSMIVFSHIKHPMINDISTPLTMQTIQNMETMQPPPMTTSPVFVTPDPTTTTDFPTTTDIPSTTTTLLTTDPLFKHYKQPSEPLKGPLYLIIQGHSKVKTYGPSKQIHGISIQETNEIDGEDEFNVKHLHFKENKKLENPKSKSDLLTLKHVIETGLGKLEFDGIDRKGVENVEEINNGTLTNDDDEVKKPVEETISRKTRDINNSEEIIKKMSGLHTLKHVIQAGWGKLDMDEEEIDDQKEGGVNYRKGRSSVINSNRKINSKGDIAETEVKFGYQVVDGVDVTSERYYKGIVEQARKLKLNKA